ncbi:MAG: hypothetical protein ABSH07_10370 [Candidatus Dormibacteria bacterium]|jgi:hypothetical protein
MTAGAPIALPSSLLAALRDRDEVLVTSRAGTRTGTVRMSFAVAPPGVVYLLTSAFSRKALRWQRDPWVRLAVPGTGVAAEAVAHRVGAEEMDPAAEAIIVERFATAGATTPESLRQLLEVGTHLLLRIDGGSAGSPVRLSPPG